MPAIAKPELIQQDGVTVIRYRPSVSTITEDIIGVSREPVLQAADTPAARVVVDLSGVEFFSSSFIDLLFQLWRKLNANGGRFALCHLHDYCREILQVTNLDKIWTIRDTLDQAIANVNGSEPA